MIISLSDTCSQGQLCGWGYSALETYFLNPVIIVIITSDTLIITRLLKGFPVNHYSNNKHLFLFYSFVLNTIMSTSPYTGSHLEPSFIGFN